jgi:hypothetical protein
MAIVRQNQYNAAFATTVNPSVTWTNATLASDVLVVFITHNNAASSSSITPPAGGGGEPTWTALTGINLLGNTAQSTWIQPYWSTGTAVSAGHVSTFTLGTNTRDSVTWGIQYSGVDTVSPVDQQAGNFSNTANTSWDSGTSATTTNPNDVLLSLVSLGNDGAGENVGAFTTEVPVGWSTVFGPLRSSAGTATQGLTCYGFEFLVSATSAPHLAATMGVSALWSGNQLSLKAASTSASATVTDELSPQFQFSSNPWNQGPFQFYEARDEFINLPLTPRRIDPIVVSPVVKDSQVW